MNDLSERLTTLASEGAFAELLSEVALESDAAATAAAISASINSLCRSHRDIQNMVVLAHVGASWCLGQAHLQSDQALATSLKRRAHAMCFNAAANCWPGWGDEGVILRPNDVAAGRVLAGLCLALAQDLAIGAKAEGKAHWLVGALELALGNFSAARAAFSTAEQSFASLPDGSEQILMVQGYDALAQKLETPRSGEGERALAARLDALKALGTEDGVFFAAQIARADEVLAQWATSGRPG
jgi:hypothetical protein